MNPEGGKLNQNEAQEEPLSPEEQAIKEKIQAYGRTKHSFLSTISEDIPERLLRDKEVQKIAREKFIENLKEGYVGTFQAIQKWFKLDDKILEDEEVKKAGYDGVIARLSYSDGPSALEIKKMFKFDNSLFNKPEIRDGIAKSVIRIFQDGNVDWAIEVQNGFKLSDKDIFDREDVKKAAGEKITECLEYLESGKREYGGGINSDKAFDLIEKATKIQGAVNLGDDFLQKGNIVRTIKKSFIMALEGRFYSKGPLARDIFTAFHLDNSVLKEEETVEAIQSYITGIIYAPVNPKEYRREILEQIGVDSQTINEYVRSFIQEKLDEGQLGDAVRPQENIPLPQKEFVELINKHIAQNPDERWAIALEVANKLNIPKTLLKTPEIIRKVTDYMIEQIAYSAPSRAMNAWKLSGMTREETLEAAKEIIRKRSTYSEIQKIFSLSAEELLDIAPSLSNLLEQVQVELPILYTQAMKSGEVLSFLGDNRHQISSIIQTVEGNKFIREAIETNPRYGVKLLFAYPGFDETSRRNIDTIFTNWESIVTNNPDLDPHSKKFGILVAEKLISYARNGEIIQEIKQLGIDTDRWLAYDRKDEFTLGEKEDVLLSEKISPPTVRIGVTIDLYIKVLSAELQKHKEELSAKKLAGKIDEVKISELILARDDARASGNTKKAETINREIGKESNPQELTPLRALEQKILNLNRLKKNLLQAKEKLSKLEKENLNQSEIGKSTEEYRLKFIAFREEWQSFRDNINTELTKEIGNLWNESESAIQNTLQEGFIHIGDDISEIASVLKDEIDPNSSEQPPKKNNLAKNKMSISVAPRDPNTYLYLGNYCPCCISIEGGEAGDPKHSAIADFGTDLGVQIVTINDDTLEIPVASAWIWLSKDKDDKPVFVIDNIEGNPEYYSNFPDKLGARILDYLKGYAEDIGAGRVVMGVQYNKLPTAETFNSFKKSQEKYKKSITNCGRDYYLEAEDAETRIVWEKA